MPSRQAVLIATVLGLLGAIVFTDILRPSSRRFQLVVLDKSDRDFMLLDSQEGRVWESMQLSLPLAPFGLKEMIRLDSPDPHYSTERKAWAKQRAERLAKQKESLVQERTSLVDERKSLVQQVERLKSVPSLPVIAFDREGAPLLDNYGKPVELQPLPEQIGVVSSHSDSALDAATERLKEIDASLREIDLELDLLATR